MERTSGWNQDDSVVDEGLLEVDYSVVGQLLMVAAVDGTRSDPVGAFRLDFWPAALPIGVHRIADARCTNALDQRIPFQAWVL